MTTITKTLKSFVLLVLLSVLAGCFAEVQIISPAKNAVSNEAPEFRLRFRDAVPDSFSATLNGIELNPNSFTIEGKDAYLQVDLAMLQPGNNEFAVTDPAEASRIFHLDLVGPVIHILGAEGSDPKTVTGYLADKGGATSLTINGNDIALADDGSFTSDISVANIYEALATDIFGFTTSESYAALGQSFDPAIGVRVNQQGLEESLPNAILTLVESIDFNSFITNPIAESCTGAVIADACARFSINDVTLTPGSTVDIQALSGNRLRVDIGLSRLDLDTTATTYARCKSFLCGGSGSIFGTLNFSGVTTVQNTDIAADFIVSISNGEVSVEIVDGTLDVDLPANGLSVDIDFGAVEDVPFVGDLFDTVINGIINGLVGILSSVIVDIADGFLADPISDLMNSLISSILPDNIAIPVAETTVNLGFTPESFATSAGGFDLELANSISIDAVDPNVLPPLGSLYVAGDAPNPYPTTTPENAGVDLTATVSANLLNQVLTEAYKGGLLNITLDEDDGLSIGTFASIPDFPIDLTGVTEFNIQLSGGSAPAISVLSQADSDDGVVFLSLLDLNLKVNADFDDDNGLQEILNTTIDLRSPFDIGVTPENTLTIGIEATPEVNVHGFTFKLGGLTLKSGSNGVISNLIATLAPELLPEILSSVEGIPIPSIEGFTLQLLGVWNPNASNNAFLSLGGNLVLTAASAVAPAPVVSATVAEKAFSLFDTETMAEKRSATILVAGDSPSGAPLEYRYRVNGGHWTIWKQRSEIALSYLPGGENIVDVCSRTEMLKSSCTQVSISVPYAD
ncbi:MAG: hypothetical protein MI976_07515 [Pseudomonadales bacterium]|nr:hypothetical protein [Pseudomonadales bacterium]